MHIQPLNILFSTTRQWNPGDEFIFRGVRNILREAGVAFNTLIYNRNPVVNPDSGGPARGTRADSLKENSLDLTEDIEVDVAVVAGTPEWRGSKRAEEFLTYIRRRRLPVLFLGVGGGVNFKPEGDLLHLLRKQTVAFTARDLETHESVKPFFPEAQLLACPSIMSSTDIKPFAGVERVGCMIQTTGMLWQSIPAAEQQWLYAHYESIAALHSVEYVAHYVDDIASSNIPKSNRKMEGVWPWRRKAPQTRAVHYSGVSDEYYNIYRRFDLVVGPRLHGCGIAASMGIPSVCVVHDTRGGAAELFGAVLARQGDDLAGLVRETDWAERAATVAGIRTAAGSVYREIVRDSGCFAL